MPDRNLKWVTPAFEPVNYRLPATGLVGVGVFVFTKALDRVWMSRRLAAAKTFVGYWQVPGGSVEEGEEPKAAAVRELQEETGIIASRRTLRHLASGCFRKESGETYVSHHFAMVTAVVPINLEITKSGPFYPMMPEVFPHLRLMDAIRAAADSAAFERFRRKL